MRKRCDVLGVGFSSRMLQWHQAAEPVFDWPSCANALAATLEATDLLTDEARAVAAECTPMYRRLLDYRMQPQSLGD